MRDVVQHQAADRDRPQVHDRRGLFDVRKARVVRMEGERNEDLEAAGLVLQLPESDQVVDAMERVFHVPVKHRAVGLQAQMMRRTMNVEPLAGIGLVLAELAADLRMENLRPAAGHAA
jgi:hypothetical protein